MKMLPPERCKWCGSVENILFGICESCADKHDIDRVQPARGKLRNVDLRQVLDQRRAQAWN